MQQVSEVQSYNYWGVISRKKCSPVSFCFILLRLDKQLLNLSCFCFFSGVYTFGLFTVDIFVNAGQVVTGNLAPYFLTVCKPNYTALGCQQALRYISHQEACTGNQDDILRARKTFPSKEAALSVYAALYLAVSSASWS